MCDPTTIAVIGLIGTGVSTYAAIEQGNNAKDVAAYNATMQEYAAEDATRRGEEAVAEQRNRNRALIGQQRAAIAANGLDLGSGTPLDTLMATTRLGEEDIATIRSNAAREAWGLRSGARLTMAQGNASQAAGYASAFGTLLGSAGTNYKNGQAAGWWK